MIIDSANYALSEAFIKQLHAVLKSGTSDSRLGWFAVGDYKRLPNELGGMDTTAPEKVSTEIRKLLAEYNSIANKTFDNLLDFHYRFERIHPFQDGNGRVGRLLLFKECLRNNIVPFIIAVGNHFSPLSMTFQTSLYSTPPKKQDFNYWRL